MLFNDFDSAFNTVISQQLTEKLYTLQLDPGLSYRPQSVKIGKRTASFSSNHIIKFADDPTVVSLIINNDDMLYRKEVEQLTKWCGKNNLSLNVEEVEEPSSAFTSCDN